MIIKSDDILLNDDITHQIIETIGKHSFETGGILGEIEGVICRFQFDLGIEQKDRDMYIPNIDFLNRVLEKWYKENVTFAGFIHSHKDNNILSSADIYFAEKIMIANHLDCLYMLIYNMKIKKISFHCVKFD